MSQQQQQMAMGGMTGGPVGGAGPGAQQQPGQMNAGTPSSGADGGFNSIKRLNTAIYDYLLRAQLYDVARMFVKQVDVELVDKESPNQRQGQPNGIDDGMDIDQDNNIKARPKDLMAPAPLGDGPFLQDWWCQFWEIFHGHRGKGKTQVMNYIGAQRQAQKARTQMMPAAGNMDPNMQRYNNMMMQNMAGNGMPDLKRAAMQNNQTRMTPQQQQQMMQNMQRQGQNPQMMAGNQMERQGSQMDGTRSGSPGSGDAPSPKRPRLDGQMQPMNQGRPGPPQQMPSNQVGLPQAPNTPSMRTPDPTLIAQTQELLRHKGVDPATIPPQQLAHLAMQDANHQAKSVETYSASIKQSMAAAMQTHANGANKGMSMPPNSAAMAAASMGAGVQGSPMSQNAGIDGATAEFYNATNGGRIPPSMMAGGNAAAAAQGNGGNHALQDYQMQLMLLEQQNKKRLLMARQEQDSMANPAGGMPPGNGQFPPPGMSPGQAARAAGDPSPNAGEGPRGTPKMGKPGMSPNGDMTGRGSPQPGMQMPGGMMNDNMRQQLQMQQNGQFMRPPPSSHPMGPGTQMSHEQMHMLQQVPNGAPRQMVPAGMMQGQPGQPMMPGQIGQPPNPNMTPRQQPMAPPPVPTGTQPSSPAPPAAPPTPSQTNKAKPGGKKEGGKKNNKKGGATGATPASESEQPPTPTPATPITPMNQHSFNQNKNLPNGQQPQNAQPPTQPPQSQPNAVQPPQPPPSDMGQPFGSLDGGDFGNINMDFANLDGGDVLDNFDFDVFLNTNDNENGLGWDANLAFGGDGLEAGGDLGTGN